MSALTLGDILYILNSALMAVVFAVITLAYRRTKVPTLRDVALMFGLLTAGYTLTTKPVTIYAPGVVPVGVALIFAVPYVIILISSKLWDIRSRFSILAIAALVICWAAIAVWLPRGEIKRIDGPWYVVATTILCFFIPQLSMIAGLIIRASKAHGVTRCQRRC